MSQRRPPSIPQQQRQQAEEELQRIYNEPGAAMLLFKIIELHAAGPTEPDVSIRQAAAVNFKASGGRWAYVSDARPSAWTCPSAPDVGHHSSRPVRTW